jgi:diguanylate cyclase (GGDEF)-like protein/PAS domain S-box-containing protein
MMKLNKLTLQISIPLVLIVLLFGIIFSVIVVQTVVAGSLIVITLVSFIVYIDRIISRQMSGMGKALEQARSVPERGVEEGIRQPALVSVGSTREIAETQSARLQLQLASVVFEHSQEGIMITDAQANILNVNPAFIRVTGCTAEACIGKNPRILKSGRHDTLFYEKMWQSLKDTGNWEGEIWNRRKNGEVYPQWLNISAIRTEQGEITHYVAVFQDITDIKYNQEQITYQAHHDALTGLPNKSLFQDHLEMALARAKRYGYGVGVMFLDLDHFKNVNDSFGHHIGDLLLQEAAKRFKSCCRGADTIARLGGDVFMIILPDLKIDGKYVTEVAQRILTAFSQPFQIQHQEIVSTVSIGIAIYPDDGEDVITLGQNADTAMNRAKEQGRNTYVLYTKTMHALVIERMELDKNLRKAFENEEFRVYYQPQIDVRTGLISGTEALVRWQRSVNELVPPEKFIPLAEETGLIIPLGAWVLRTACQQTKAWHDAGFNSLTISVNLSAKQFQDTHLVQLVKNVLEETGLAPQFLYLEITESTLMKDIDTAVEIMSVLEEIGVHLSIDDFGTGYSSLSALKNFPFDELKMDKSFVKELPNRPNDIAIAKAILSLSHSLNLKVLAEGVETPVQLEFMRTNECNGIQGFLFSRPIPPKELTVLLKEGKKLQ